MGNIIPGERLVRTKTPPRREPDDDAFSPDERRIALALAQAVLPPGRVFRGADARTVDALSTLLSRFGKGAVRRYAYLLHALEQGARWEGRGHPFSALSRDRAERLLTRWGESDALPQRMLAFGLSSPLKIAYFDDPEIYRILGCTYRFGGAGVARETPAFLRQVTAGETLEEDVELECDAVVVGTGAGGAVIAKELAARGHAVVMVEEGAYHTRADFHGGPVESFASFYRGKGLTGSMGNTFIPIPMGRLVGGSTAINTGTCWRTPDWILERWVKEGLAELTPDRMAPYFERVERALQVEVADASVLGGAARVIARGCEALGYSHGPVRRNAPGCDGSSTCDFGCPTDARRSTNISYVPPALRSGAQLFTGVRAERVILERGRARGLVARSLSNGRKVTVRARATILACGTLVTPGLLQRQGLDRGLPQVGRNLSIHPATIVSALFDEPILGYRAIPQGYCIDEFRREGILPLGASAPIDLGSAQFAFFGERLMHLMESYDKIASFGVMVEDRSRGQVRLGPGGQSIVLYWLGREEQRRLLRGVEIVARVFLAAGAREVYPALHGHRALRGPADLAHLRDGSPAAADWILTAFHPLGTCRMSTSAKNGVVSPRNQVHGLPGLYIADGSVVPGSVAVNPQVTIMALATRAADLLAEELDRGSV